MVGGFWWKIGEGQMGGGNIKNLNFGQGVPEKNK